MKKLLIILCFIALFSCKDNSVKTETSDKYIFGFFAGYVATNIYSHIYKFENNTLYEDTNHDYATYFKEYDANWKKMPDSMKVHLNNTIWEIPQQLYNEKDTVFGMPDAYDQGGFYLQVIKKDGTSRYWLFDSNTKDIPQYMVSYIENLRSIIWKFNGY